VPKAGRSWTSIPATFSPKVGEALGYLQCVIACSAYNTSMSRLYPSRPIVGVGAVILRSGEVLIVRRANPPLQGSWSIPGGALELGEKLRDGIAREVLEETGLDVEVGPLLDVFDSIHTDDAGQFKYHYVLVDFLCRPGSGIAKAASDACELRWARPEELEALGMKQVTIDLIRKALALESASV